MSKPLLITDCDDVLLHMLGPFGAWLGDEHDIDFNLVNTDYTRAMRHRSDNRPVTEKEIWPLVNGFFDHAMHLQTAAPHAMESLHHIAQIADVVVLTNLEHHRQPDRVAQLASHGVHFPVHCNQGGKGPRVAELIAEYRPSVAVFVDDHANHHESVAELVPSVWRLHLHMDPLVSRTVPPSDHAHHRLDDWLEARQWIIARMKAGHPADHVTSHAISA